MAFSAEVLAADMEQVLSVRPPYDSPGTTNWSAIIGGAGCDCSGVPAAIFARHGGSLYHGSNTIARKYADGLTKLTKASQLQVGVAVYKHKMDGGEPAKYQADGLGNFHHIGIVTSTSPLRIVHQSSTAGCTTVDTNISKWGYCSKLKGINYGTPVNPEKPQEGDYMYQAMVTANLKVRQSPGKDAQRVGGLKAGMVVNVYQEADGWARINYNDQVSGWSSMQYLKPLKTSADDAPAPDAPAASQPVHDCAAQLAAVLERMDDLEQRVRALEAGVDQAE